MILSNHSYFFEELGLTSFTTLQNLWRAGEDLNLRPTA